MNIEARIREFAYQIWESEGRPDGQQARHWEMARKLAEAEAASASQATPRKRSGKAKSVTLADVEAEVNKPELLKKPRPRSSTAKAPTAPKAPKTPRA